MADVLNVSASTLYNNVTWAKSAPQIHIHFLGSNQDPTLGAICHKVEVCCHGCGAALLVTYAGEEKTLVGIRDRFQRQHHRCPNRHYQHRCPDIRTAIRLMDVGALPVVELTR